MKQNYRIRFSDGSTEFEFEGDKKFVIDLFKMYYKTDSLKNSAPSPEKSNKLLKQGAVKDKSLVEFIRDYNPKKHTDYVLAFAYYLEKVSGKESFTPMDINNCYYEAKMEKSNTSQMIIYNIKRGYLMAAKKAKSEKVVNNYTITSSGIDFVEKLKEKK